MNRISIKLIGFFLVIIFASTALSFMAVSLFSRQLLDEIALDQRQIAHVIQALRERTSLTLDELVSILSSSTYTMSHVRFVDPETIDPIDLIRLQSDEIVILQEGRLRRTTTLLRTGDSYVRIDLHPQKNVLTIWASRLWNSIAFYIAIAGILIIALTNRVVHPVLELTDATREVARGNFDIQIETRRNDEIGQLTMNFNTMVRRLRSIEYLHKDFIGNVSHEIRTPLASIQGFARLLQTPGLSDTQRSEYTQAIVEETSRLSQLSTAMLRLSKLESLDSIDVATRFRLDEQIRRSIVLLEPQWTQRKIDFGIRLEAAEVAGNEELLQQVWLNLIGNAVKFSKPNGRIDVSLLVQPGALVVTIRDHGEGIRETDMPRIFEKFFQADRAHSVGGSGLGLSLVKRIVDLHQGEISVDSRWGKGSAFTVILPCSLSSAATPTDQPGATGSSRG